MSISVDSTSFALISNIQEQHKVGFVDAIQIICNQLDLLQKTLSKGILNEQIRDAEKSFGNFLERNKKRKSEILIKFKYFSVHSPIVTSQSEEIDRCISWLSNTEPNFFVSRFALESRAYGWMQDNAERLKIISGFLNWLEKAEKYWGEPNAER